MANLIKLTNQIAEISVKFTSTIPLNVWEKFKSAKHRLNMQMPIYAKESEKRTDEYFIKMNEFSEYPMRAQIVGLRLHQTISINLSEIALSVNLNGGDVNNLLAAIAEATAEVRVETLGSRWEEYKQEG